MNNSVEMKRDCEAVQIPAGTTITLPAGTPVDITQTLGGTYTVNSSGGLYRIATKDLDALGIEPTSLAEEVAKKPEGHTGPVDEQQVWDTLKTCFDPEIPVNIVADLGLVYDMHVEPLPSGNSKILVKMTLTAPGCGIGESDRLRRPSKN